MTEPTTETPVTKEVLKGIHVLVVDDEVMISDILSRAFGRKGALVETANDGEEALQRINGKNPDLIITDNSMPKMTGPELIKRLRENPLTHDVPVILMSGDLFEGLSPEETQEKALSLQANAGITKPFSISVPVAIAEQLLSAKQS